MKYTYTIEKDLIIENQTGWCIFKDQLSPKGDPWAFKLGSKKESDKAFIRIKNWITENFPELML
jgi:hypothetical protein